MRIILILSVILFQGCSTVDAYLDKLSPPICPGHRYYDPQTCRGEKFQRLPNFENEAQERRKRGEYW